MGKTLSQGHVAIRTSNLNKAVTKYAKIAELIRPIDFTWLERIFEQCAWQHQQHSKTNRPQQK